MGLLAISSLSPCLITLVHVPSGSVLMAALFVLTDSAQGLVAGLWLGVLAAEEVKYRPFATAPFTLPCIARTHAIPVYVTEFFLRGDIVGPPSDINVVLGYAACVANTPSRKPASIHTAAPMSTKTITGEIDIHDTCSKASRRSRRWKLLYKQRQQHLCTHCACCCSDILETN